MKYLKMQMLCVSTFPRRIYFPTQNVKSANEAAVKNKIYTHLQRRFSSSLHVYTFLTQIFVHSCNKV